MINKKYIDSEEATHIICSVRDCNNLVIIVKDFDIRDKDANMFCSRCSSATLDVVKSLEKLES